MTQPDARCATRPPVWQITGGVPTPHAAAPPEGRMADSGGAVVRRRGCGLTAGDAGGSATVANVVVGFGRDDHPAQRGPPGTPRPPPPTSWASASRQAPPAKAASAPTTAHPRSGPSPAPPPAAAGRSPNVWTTLPLPPKNISPPSARRRNQAAPKAATERARSPTDFLPVRLSGPSKRPARRR